jgi:hypothetical protein
VLPCRLLSVGALLLFPDAGLSDRLSTTLAAPPLQLILMSVAPGAFHVSVRLVPALILEGVNDAVIEGVGGTYGKLVHAGKLVAPLQHTPGPHPKSSHAGKLLAPFPQLPGPGKLLQAG